MNEDYIKGMKILLRISHKRGTNIRRIKWIPSLCQKLSEHGVCETFWKEVIKQNSACYLFHAPSQTKNLKYWVSFFLVWDKTPQGYNFWNDIYNSLPNKP